MIDIKYLLKEAQTITENWDQINDRDSLVLIKNNKQERPNTRYKIGRASCRERV